MVFKSIKVHQGCSLTLQHVTVDRLDATNGGKVYLEKCMVGWDVGPIPSSSSSLSLSTLSSSSTIFGTTTTTPRYEPIPFLVGTKPDNFTNPYNVSGTVILRECSPSDFSSSSSLFKKRKSKPPKRAFAFSNPDDKDGRFLVAGYTIGSKTGMIERTITNISDKEWHVRFEPIVGSVSCCNFLQQVSTRDVLSASDAHYVKADPKGEQTFFTATIPPLGGCVIIRASKSRMQGRIFFIDYNGAEYEQLYTSASTFFDFTICSPTTGYAGVTRTDNGDAGCKSSLNRDMPNQLSWPLQKADVIEAIKNNDVMKAIQNNEVVQSIKKSEVMKTIKQYSPKPMKTTNKIMKVQQLSPKMTIPNLTSSSSSL